MAQRLRALLAHRWTAGLRLENTNVGDAGLEHLAKALPANLTSFALNGPLAASDATPVTARGSRRKAWHP